MDYSEDRAAALEMITEFGTPVNLVRVEFGELNPSTGTRPDLSAQLSGVAVFDNYSAFELPDSSIRSRSRKMYYCGDDLKLGDEYGRERVMDVEIIDPDGSGQILVIARLER